MTDKYNFTFTSMVESCDLPGVEKQVRLATYRDGVPFELVTPLHPETPDYWDRAVRDTMMILVQQMMELP